MSRGPHPLTMIGRRNPRVLDDGCDTCGFSAVYCKSVQYHAQLPCCEHCDH